MYTVYIIDDEPLIREGLRKLIDWESLGFTIIGDAASAEEAAEPIIAFKPDLLITDIKLPGTSGINMIQNLRQRGFDGEIFIISGFADFSYAKSAIRYGAKSYLLKPIDERELIGELFALKNALSQKKNPVSRTSSHIAPSHQWFSFLNRQGPLPESIGDGGSCSFSSDASLRIVILSPTNDSQIALSDSCITESLNQQGIHELIPLYCPVTQAVLLSAQPDRSLELSLQSLLACLRQKLDMDFSCAVGAPVDRMDDLPDSFVSAQFLLTHRFLYGPENPLWFQSLDTQSDISPTDSLQFTNEIQEALLYDRREDLQMILERWRNQFVRMQSDEIVVKVTFSNLIQQISSFITSRQPELAGDLADFQVLTNQIYLARNITELTDHLYTQLCAAADVLSTAIPDAPILRAIDYIEHYYMNKLTVDSVAQTFHYNSAYFGRKFKSHVGESFQVYLEKVRLEKAKRLILEGYKIYQVSALVGFSSVDYFAEKFRLYVGLTPSQYRRQHASL